MDQFRAASVALLVDPGGVLTTMKVGQASRPFAALRKTIRPPFPALADVSAGRLPSVESLPGRIK